MEYVGNSKILEIFPLFHDACFPLGCLICICVIATDSASYFSSVLMPGFLFHLQHFIGQVYPPASFWNQKRNSDEHVCLFWAFVQNVIPVSSSIWYRICFTAMYFSYVPSNCDAHWSFLILLFSAECVLYICSLLLLSYFFFILCIFIASVWLAFLHLLYYTNSFFPSTNAFLLVNLWHFSFFFFWYPVECSWTISSSY